MSNVVQEIKSAERKTPYGDKTAYSVKINGKWFQHGFTRPKFQVGDTIEFVSSENDYGMVIDVKSVRTIATGTDVPAGVDSGQPVQQDSGRKQYQAKVFPVPETHGDRSIIRQNSLNHATSLVVTFLDLNKGAYVDGDIDNASDLIIKIARKFEAYSSGTEDRV